MTRRIAITILLTVLGGIVCAGSAAWLTARTILVADLDQSIVRRAVALPVLGRHSLADVTLPGDRFIVQGGVGQTLDRPAISSIAPPRVKVVDASFVRLPEGTYRRLVLRLPAESLRSPTTIIYSAPADDLDRILGRLALALVSCGALAAAIAAAVSANLARISLRPLADAAKMIAAVNETSLDRRLDQSALPGELRPMAQQLNRMLGRLQTAFDQRRRFVADASHELRTPTSAMITTLEVALRRPRTAPELQEAMNICLTEARHMRQLVQSLLRQVRAEGESPGEQISDFDASELVRQCTGVAQSLAREKDIQVVSSASGSLPVRAEPSRLRSVLMNLLSNAIEYSKSGGSVQVLAREAGERAEILVKDDGPGISPEDLPHLFQPFYRADRDRDCDGHLGLGLFLVEAHLKRMGGECRVESAFGQGSTFFVRIPLSRGRATDDVGCKL